MKKGTVILLAVVAVILIFGIVGCTYTIGVRNDDAKLRNTITAKQKDNQSQFDNMWKKIAQAAEVTDEAKTALQQIFIEHAKARTTGGGGLMKWVQESVPDIKADSLLYKNLMNIITGSRDSWTMRQKELLDLKREHDNLIDTVPSGWILAMMGRDEKMDVVIITSSKTEKTFETGKDDDVGIFKKKPE